MDTTNNGSQRPNNMNNQNNKNNKRPNKSSALIIKDQTKALL